MKLLQNVLSIALLDTSMGKALINTALGMGTVFSVLIFISVLIGLFALIPKLEEMLKKKNVPEINTADKNTIKIKTTKIKTTKKNKAEINKEKIKKSEKNIEEINTAKKNKLEKNIAEINAPSVNTTIQSLDMNSELEENLVDDQELVAVITAAIMASMGENTPADGLVVRSIRKVNKKKWANL